MKKDHHFYSTLRTKEKKMANKIATSKPPFRKLRGYAFDPITSLNLETADINQIVYKVPWEENLKPGPEGEYIKVIDRDPASNATYAPVDLNDPHLLASDGLTPSETNPQFHQQMVYAVVMSTIKNFERALGRKVIWSPLERTYGGKTTYHYVDKLFVYPHGFRDQNAYYSPERKALLFGYYNAMPVQKGLFLPNGIVYSCLSHDIIAHETTHALLDSMYSRYMESSNPDVAAFHEGFADIVALLQHFTYPEIVRNQLALVRGELDAESLLGKLAVEFGESTGYYSSLRDAIGSNENGTWKRTKPNTTDYESNFECHERGALLVSAIFDAFIAIYKNRTADLLRIATNGTGILAHGAIHPDLVNRLAEEAATTASHILTMCVRALDYCPPVDINYGDYLRALITADKELVSDDKHHYRIAFINAFRKRGIFPDGVPNLSVDTLFYNTLQDEDQKSYFTQETIAFLRVFKEKLAYQNDREKIFETTKEFITSGDKERGIKGLHYYIYEASKDPATARRFEQLTGLVFSDQYKKLGIRSSRTYRVGPSIEVHTLRLHNRVGPDGNQQSQIILTLAQRCGVSSKINKDNSVSFHPFHLDNSKEYEAGNFTFRGGCTMIFDLDTLTLRHVIRKPIFSYADGNKRKMILNEDRVKKQYDCLYGSLSDKLGFAADHHHGEEAFAHIHKSNNAFYGW